LTVLWLQLSG